jgi:subtilisin family serine protease
MHKTDNSSPSCGGLLLAALTFWWILFVSLNAQLLAWIGPMIGDIGQMGPTLAQVILLGLPLLLLTWLWRGPYERAIFKAWLLAIGYLLLLTPSRFLASTQSQLMLLTQLALSLAYLGLIGLMIPPAPTPPQRFLRFNLGLALGLAAPVIYPWLAVGALGSGLDTVLSITLGLTAGFLAALIIQRTWLAMLAAEPSGQAHPGRDIFIGGLVMGAILMIAASGLSFNGGQLLLMLVLPALGWAAIIVSAWPKTFSLNPSNLPTALLIGLTAAAVLALTDTDGLVIQAMDPALGWLYLAAMLSAGMGWLVAGLALAANWVHKHWPYAGPVLAGATAAAWLLAGLIYLATGQPGLYGDRLFVILKDQADVSAAVNLTNYDERRAFVYTTLVDHARRSQADLRAALDILRVEYTPYYLVNALEVRGGLLHRLWLSTRPEVDRVIPSPVMRPLPQELSISSGQMAAPSQPQWNLTNIEADKVWAELGVTGQGVVIGQSDSGVQYDHPELEARYRGQGDQHDYNWLDPWYDTAAPVDYGGHGTHTLGSVLGQTVGVAPGAEWFACANLSRNLGNPALYLDCMQFMLAPYPRHGDPFSDGDPLRSAHVLNNSWGCPQNYEGCDPASLQPAVTALRAAGIFVVASAGNDGPACSTVTDPIAIYDEALSVGAVDEANHPALFSSAGPVTVDGSQRVKPDIVAPGVDVLSAFPGSSYAVNSGTSMAGPHVAGVVALMWSANPRLMGQIERTEQILFETATPLNDQADNVDPIPASLGGCLSQTDTRVKPNNVAGYGLINAYEAVISALAEP